MKYLRKYNEQVSELFVSEVKELCNEFINNLNEDLQFNIRYNRGNVESSMEVEIYTTYGYYFNWTDVKKDFYNLLVKLNDRYKIDTICVVPHESPIDDIILKKRNFNVNDIDINFEPFDTNTPLDDILITIVEK